MKLCYQCLIKEEMKVEQPQILKVYSGCTSCGSHKMSWLKKDVEMQIYRLRKLNERI